MNPKDRPGAALAGIRPGGGGTQTTGLKAEGGLCSHSALSSPSGSLKERTLKDRILTGEPQTKEAGCLAGHSAGSLEQRSLALLKSGPRFAESPGAVNKRSL